MLSIMQETSKKHFSRGKSVGFVPTMGALHEGHMSLIKRAKSENDTVVVSIFVNPLQFGRNEDFGMYPRDREGDREKLQSWGADILFAPDDAVIYPAGFLTGVEVQELSGRLCGAFRPGHFRGVATVVCKLFNIVRPTSAYFGQKDFQQSVIIRRMAEDLNMGVDVTVCPTMREPDGLAMSSRNAYLSPAERKASTILYRTLTAASEMIRSGAAGAAEVKEMMQASLTSEPLIAEIQYAGIYDPATLLDRDEIGKQNLLAISVKIGGTRLIDNMLAEKLSTPAWRS